MKKPIIGAILALLTLAVAGCTKDSGSDLPPSSDPTIGQPSQVRDKAPGAEQPSNRTDPMGGKAGLGGGKGSKG
jgi:hypothetical protein